ncbi:MAG TPA: FeoB-associated Cys-rich membrane protein [Candidatus Eisenbergiella stercorigallinarum]|uniref:FeoB-associated Cys-rich membrane protein n=1 Tax=Candidatus Eisenbergiella stercorigallinarum TaxID=2838557 RepID=A0A9D2TZU5_9FIRM|nr:FeoB-associated Cys-rich membrane protein [Candidatus Eisenbergiella stercorigallinarum]
MSFLINNAGTVLTAAALLLAVFLVAGKMARDRKAGKGCCGGSCACCSGNRADSRNHTEGGHMPRRSGQKQEGV